jgi:KaiC/GvpD/RAD55 family RecA-like ATPase
MRAGEWFVDNDDLISKIIKQYATSTMKTGRVVKEVEDGGMSSGDFKSAQLKSKETAKAALPSLVQQLVDKIEELKEAFNQKVLKEDKLEEEKTINLPTLSITGATMSRS